MTGKFRQIWSKLTCDIKADCDSLVQYRSQSGNPDEPVNDISRMILLDSGSQSLAAIRLMHFFRDSGLPKAGEIASRLIRYVYGMEIHWKAEIAPGAVIEHGPGLVISKAAKIGPNCVLCQHVTLGDMRDPRTMISGAPTLEENVFVGPGSILLGPITIGKFARIMAGCVVTESVPPYGIVTPAKSEFQTRIRKPG